MRNTFLTERKLGTWILPRWEHGAIINVDQSIEDAGQVRGRESLKRPGIVRPGWGVGKRNVGRTWAVRGLRERHHCPPQLPPQPNQGEGGMGSQLLLLCVDPQHRQSHPEDCQQLTTNTICSLIKTFLPLELAIVPLVQGGKRRIWPGPNVIRNIADESDSYTKPCHKIISKGAMTPCFKY